MSGDRLVDLDGEKAARLERLVALSDASREGPPELDDALSRAVVEAGDERLVCSFKWDG